MQRRRLAMKKFTKRYVKPADWNFKNHFLAGTEWTVTGSKDNVYAVTLTTNGFECSCTGFKFQGKCKHTVEIIERFD